MVLGKEELQELLLGPKRRRRFTQDSPVYPDVWLAYRNRPATDREDLLLEPHFEVPVGALAVAVQKRLGGASAEHQLAWAGEHVAVRLTLQELLRDVLPLSKWWRDLLRPQQGSVFAHLAAFADGRKLAPESGGEAQEVPPPEDELEWWVRVAGRLLTNTSDEEAKSQNLDNLRTLTKRVLEELDDPKDAVDPRPPEQAVPPLWSVSRNRAVNVTMWRSRQTVKADAASLVFPVDIEGLAWAVVDSGIDARHPAFQRRNRDGKLLPDLPDDFTAHTIVRKTYDFTSLRERIATEFAQAARPAQAEKAIHDSLESGLTIDWTRFISLIEMKHDADYRAPRDPHGTHVAGTIAGNWRADDPGKPPRHALEGICPGLTLYDLRVLNEVGKGYEFSVLAALSFVRWLNSQSSGMLIHGANLSISLEHDVRNSACGRSPVCQEATRVHNSGVVVVTAAGNEGRADFTYQGEPPREGYRTVSISDPGNTEVAITVGSTHRIEPHAYGISYFSSRGPTGDGRAKPDLVAPGEKITGPAPNGESARMDGTSMAAPHVSGAAALLMARHRELVGQPDRVKRVLCGSATDLGREHHYQGSGMLDILRAIQSV
jgi:subtilisin family serine protease